MPQPRVIVASHDIRSVKNVTGSGTAIAANRVVKLDTTTDDGAVVAAASTDLHYGVSMAAIADTEYGDVQIRGRAVCTAGAAITKGNRVMVTTAGKVIAWTAGGGTNANVVGIAVRSAGTDGDLVEVELAGPGIIEQG